MLGTLIFNCPVTTRYEVTTSLVPSDDTWVWYSVFLCDIDDLLCNGFAGAIQVFGNVFHGIGTFVFHETHTSRDLANDSVMMMCPY